ncbi:MAG: polyribonucleotide nucleotidyltransferase [Trueperaceae bacterium]
MTIPQPKRYSTMLGGRELSLETGKYAKQVSGSVMVRYGETLVLVTAHMTDKPTPNDFLPLAVEYEERHYAIGKIPGSFQRRESRPGNQAILNARITDRQIRPLFPEGLRNEVQVIITVLSADRENDPGIIAAIGASAALSISNIPWDGPTACASVGYSNGQYIMNPTLKQLHDKESQLELTVAVSKDALLMVEASSGELSEEVMVGAIEFAQKELAPVIAVIEQMQREIGEAKAEFEPEVKLAQGEIELMERETKAHGLRDALLTPGKKERGERLREVRDGIIKNIVPDEEAEGAKERIIALKEAFNEAEYKELRRLVLEENIRADLRKPTDIRPIWIETGVIPRAHGSAVFTRGETQVLSVSTLGVSKDNRLVDGLGLEDYETFMLHYNFAPFSTGEVKRMRGTSRRELGHGNLAKRALERIVPDQKDFPYVIRVVAETFESNGSSSMATVCASSLSLMDAGVPMKKPVAGIAMGLVKEGNNYKILSDILGAEDHLGDMDFKVTGTRDGVTALQMDIKIKGITSEIMRNALAQAREGRLHILGLMDEVLNAPREELNKNAPRIVQINIPVDKIGTVIGPGGKQIRELEAYGVQIEIGEDGTVKIFSSDGEAAEKARGAIENMTKGIEIGATYEGKVAKLMDFGAFITLIPGIDGLLHISQIAEERVEKVSDYLKEGDAITVKVVGVDARGKVDLMRPELEGKVAPRAPKPDRGGGGGRGGFGGSDRGGGDRGREGGRRDDRRGGDRFNDKPRFDKPRFDKPAFDKPAFDKPAFDKPRDDRPRSNKPKSDDLSEYEDKGR